MTTFITRASKISPAHLTDSTPRFLHISISRVFRCNQIMDDRWESEVIEFGAINITGFRIVDVTRPHVKDFLAGWHRLDPAISQAGRESISVRIYISTYIQHLSYETPSFFFLTPVSSADVGFSPLPQFASREKTMAPCEMLPPPPLPPPSSTAISSRWIEYFLRFLRRPRVSVVDLRRRRRHESSSYEERESNKNHCGCRFVGARVLSLSRCVLSLCAQWLETKLVKLHPHVETWTFQPVYKVPLARPYCANRVSRSS